MIPRLALAACCLAACSDKKSDGPAPAAEQRLYLTFERERDDHGQKAWVPDVALDGAVVLLDGVVQGAIDDDGVVGVGLTPGHSFDDRTARLALQLPTPCGPREVPLPYVSASALASDGIPNQHRGAPKLTVRRDPAAPLPAGVTSIYVEDESAPAAVVRFGAVEIKPGPRRQDDRPAKGRFVRLWDLACAPAHAVTSDGVQVGTARADDPDALGFLISTDPQACYQRKVAVYADDPNAAGQPRQFPVLRGQLNATGWDGISYFLEELPAGVDRGAGYGGTTSRRSLVRVACPQGS